MSTRHKISALFLVVLFVLPPASVSAETKPTIYAEGVLAYTNLERFREGVPFLSSDPLLSKVAYQKMQDLFARQYFAHEAPTGEDVADLARGVGYEYITVGENLALGDFTSSRDVVEAWMDSPGHRKNILSPTYSEIGIAAGRSMYEGRYTWMVVQTFGLPRSSCTGLDTALQEKITKESGMLAFLERIVDMRRSALEATPRRSSAYGERVDAYNRAAELYNTRAEAYRKMVKTYNAGVDSFNECVTSKTS